LENHTTPKYNFGYNLIQDWCVYKHTSYSRTGLYLWSPVSKSSKFFHLSSWLEKLQFSGYFALVF